MCRFKKEIALKQKAKIGKKKELKVTQEKETQEVESDANDVEIDNGTTTDDEEKVDSTKHRSSSSDSSFTLVTATYCLVAFLSQVFRTATNNELDCTINYQISK